MDIVLIVLAVIVLLVVVGIILKQVGTSDQDGQKAIDDEKDRLGLQPEDSLNDPYLYAEEENLNDVDYVVQPKDVTIVEAPANTDTMIVTADADTK